MPDNSLEGQTHDHSSKVPMIWLPCTPHTSFPSIYVNHPLHIDEVEHVDAFSSFLLIAKKADVLLLIV